MHAISTPPPRLLKLPEQHEALPVATASPRKATIPQRIHFNTMVVIVVFGSLQLACISYVLRTDRIPTSPHGNHANETDIFIAVMSAAKNFNKRERVRSTCHYHGEKTRFFVATPLMTSHLSKAQGHQVSQDARDMERALVMEKKFTQDLEIVPMYDHYQHLTHKMIQMFDYGYDQGAKFVVKVDDDKCANVTFIRQILERLKDDQDLYLGWYAWRGDEYEIMKGAEGIVTPFMSGPCYGLSRGLIKAIFRDNRDGTLLFGRYGSLSEDSNVGKWVKYANKTHDLKIKYHADRRIQWRIKGVKEHDP